MHTMMLLAWVTLGASTLPPFAPEVNGVVTAPDGRAVPGATVLLRKDDERLTERVSVTDAAGHFRIIGVVPGAYRVRVEHQDYRRRHELHTQSSGGSSLHVTLTGR